VRGGRAGGVRPGGQAAGADAVGDPATETTYRKFGLRRRPVLVVGLPVWLALTPRQRATLLAMAYAGEALAVRSRPTCRTPPTRWPGGSAGRSAGCWRTAPGPSGASGSSADPPPERPPRRET